MSKTSQPVKTITGITVIRKIPFIIDLVLNYEYTKSKEPNTFQKLEELVLVNCLNSNDEFFQINFEKETRYNPNGSLATEPEDGSRCYIVGYKDKRYTVNHTHFIHSNDCDQFALKTERLFDVQEIAENWAKILNSNLEIREKIKEINFENGYTGFENGKCNHFWHLENGVIGDSLTIGQKYQGVTYMHRKTKDWMDDTLNKEKITNFIKYS